MRTAIRSAAALVVAVGLAGSVAWAVQPSAAVGPSKVLEVGRGKVPGKPAVITAVALAAGGKLLASGGDDHLVRIWNTQTGELVSTLTAHADWVRSLSFNPDHSLLLSAGDDHLLVLWKLDGDKGKQILAERGAPIYSAVFSGDGQRIAAVGFEREVTIYDSAGKVERKLEGPCEDLRCVVFAPDNARVAVVGRNGQIRVWSTADWKVALEIDADQQRIRNLAYSPDGAKLAAAGDGRRISLWDARTGELLHKLTAKPAKIMSLAFCGDELLATGGSDNTVRIWDLTKPAERWSLSGHSGSVAALACDPQTGVLASGSFDTTVRVWQFDVNGPVQETAEKPGLLPAVK